LDGNSARACKALFSLILFLGFGAPFTSSCAAAYASVNTSTPLPFPQAKRERRSPVRRGSSERRAPQRPKRLRAPDVIYYPTPMNAVMEMLRLANIKEGDVLYDLGSGDGRIPITAAQLYGIRAVGIEINPRLIWVAEERARALAVAGRVRFSNEDMFRADIHEATIVTLYLSRKLNLLLLPRLLRELHPGTRIISHDFDMGEWKPEQKVRVPWFNGYRTIYAWTIPDRDSMTSR
jgi:Methyltransferase domain